MTQTQFGLKLVRPTRKPINTLLGIRTFASYILERNPNHPLEIKRERERERDRKVHPSLMLRSMKGDFRWKVIG